MKRSTQTASAATDHALAQIQAQDSQTATEVRNTDLAAVMSMFGHRPRRIDGAILMEEEGGKPHVIWFIPKAKGEQGMSTGAIAKAWEHGMGASTQLEALIEEASALIANRPKSRLAKVIAEIKGLQYISQVEAARVAFQEKQWLMQLLNKLKKSGNNQFIIERRDGKVAMFGAGLSEQTISDMKEVASF
jgi:hypothetical protein